MPGSLRLQSGRCDILPACSEIGERQVSSSISNAANMDWRAKLMTVSCHRNRQCIRNMISLLLIRVKFLCKWLACVTCSYTPKRTRCWWLTDCNLLQSVWLKLVVMYNVHVQLLHAHLGRKSAHFNWSFTVRLGFNIPLNTHYRYFQRWSSQPITWLGQRLSLSNQLLGWY